MLFSQSVSSFRFPVNFYYSASSYVSLCSLIPPIILELMLLFLVLCSSHQKCLYLLAVHTNVWSCTENKSLIFIATFFNVSKVNASQSSQILLSSKIQYYNSILWYCVKLVFNLIEMDVINGNLKPQDFVSMGQGNIV